MGFVYAAAVNDTFVSNGLYQFVYAIEYAYLAMILLMAYSLSNTVVEAAMAKEALRASEERFRSLVEATSDWVWEVDQSGAYTYASPKASELLGYAPEEILGKTPFDLMPPDEAQHIGAIFQDAATRQRPLERLENTTRHKDGRLVVLETSGVPILDANGRLLGYRGIDRDITERKQAEEALRRSEDKFAKAFRTSPDSININRMRDGLYLEINDGFTAMTGYTPADVAGKTSLEINVWANPNDRARLAQALREHGEVVGLEAEFRMKDGSIRTGLMSARLIEVSGEPCILSITRDITERKRAEQVQAAIYRISEATQATQNLDELFSAIHTIIGELMPAKNFYIALYDASTDLFITPYLVDEFGTPSSPYKPGKGLTAYVLRTEKPLLATPEIFERLIQSGQVELIGRPSVDWLGVPLKTQQGTLGVMAVYTYTEAARLGEADKAVLVFVSTQVAMAVERKRAEAALLESEEKFRSIFNNSTAGVALVGLDGRYWTVNPAFSKIFGYSADEFLTVDFFQVTHPDDMALSRKTMQDVLDYKGKDVRFTKRYIHKDGRTIWAEVNSALVYGADGEPSHFVTHVIDVTERERAEEALRESEERFRLFMRHFPGLAYIKDSATRAIFANQGFMTYLNIAPSEILGKTNQDIFPTEFAERITADERRVFESGQSEEIEEHYGGRIWSTYLNFAQSNGHLLWRE
jgi:PAS domain S-box-containing protein